MTNQHDGKWTEDELRIIRRMWPNHSGGEIAKVINKSRAAVCGQARRLRLHKSREEKRQAQVRAGRRSSADRKERLLRDADMRKNVERIQRLRDAQLRRMNSKPDPFDPETRLDHNTAQGFRGRSCQWLYGEPKVRDFCGRRARKDSSYCPEHHAICYIPEGTR